MAETSLDGKNRVSRQGFLLYVIFSLETITILAYHQNPLIVLG